MLALCYFVLGILIPLDRKLQALQIVVIIKHTLIYCDHAQFGIVSSTDRCRCYYVGMKGKNMATTTLAGCSTCFLWLSVIKQDLLIPFGIIQMLSTETAKIANFVFLSF